MKDIITATFDTPTPLFPNITSLRLHMYGEVWTEEELQFFFSPALSSLTSSGELGPAFQTSFPLLEAVSIQTSTVSSWDQFTQDYSLFSRLRSLAIYDISFASWKALERCQELEEIVFTRAVAIVQHKLRPYISGLRGQAPVSFVKLRKLSFQHRADWRYPAEYITTLLDITTMPALRETTLGAGALAGDAQIAVMTQLVDRSPELEEVKLHQYRCSSRTLIDQLKSYRHLKKVSLTPYRGTTLNDSEVAYLAQSLSTLSELSLRYDRASLASRVQITPTCLVELVERMKELTSLEVVLNVSEATEPWQSPAVPTSRVTHLRVWPINLSVQTVKPLGTFLATLFPAVEDLTPLEDDVDGNSQIGTWSEVDDYGLPFAFELARRIGPGGGAH